MFGRKRVKPIDLKELDQLKLLLDEGKPVLIDFMQVNCRSCKIMDGIINELAEEYGTSAHVVKVDLGRVPAAAATFQVKGTPTFILFGRPSLPTAKKKAKRQPAPAPERDKQGPVVKWRGSGLVRKDIMTRALESSGAV
ncbi:MAG TPA: thioredoxin family protein, partial [Acidimicrobiia bacterium]|nr:thioredoxin family protein [Acidimicrobiia bacterium]